MDPTFEKFPEPEDLKVKNDKFTFGMNKSKRGWKVGVNRQPTKCHVSKGPQISWEDKKKMAEQKKALRRQIKEFKEKKIVKRKEMKELRKQKKKQKMYNEIKSGQFEVVKNTKNMKKWSKKVKAQLVKLPAEVFENLVNK